MVTNTDIAKILAPDRTGDYRARMTGNLEPEPKPRPTRKERRERAERIIGLAVLVFVCVWLAAIAWVVVRRVLG